MNGIENIVSCIEKMGQSANQELQSELLYGTVITDRPLSIKIDNRETLPEQFFFVGQMVNERIIKGDRVVLLSFNKGQQYYVTEILTDDPNMCFGIYQSDGGFLVDRVGYRPPEYFWMGQMVRPHKVTIPHTHLYSGKTEIEASHTHVIHDTYTGGGSSEPTSHLHDILNQRTDDVHPDQTYVTLNIYEPLAPGDRCLLFSFNKGQKYYVAEKVGV